MSSKWLFTAFVLLFPVVLSAQPVDVEFHWASSPTVDESGYPLAAALSYEVFYQRDGGVEALVASVTDTVFTLHADLGVAHRIRVRGVDKDGRHSELSPWSDEVYFDDPDRSGEQVPIAGSLRPAYPNPFNPETNIVYGVPTGLSDSTPMTLAVYDLMGRRVRSFVPDSSSGWHTITWNGRDDLGRMMPTGQYMTLFVCGDERTSSKMTMIK